MPALTYHAADGSLVALSDRIRWSALARAGLVGLLVAAWAFAPSARTVDHPHLGIVLGSYVVVIALGSTVSWAGRRWALLGIGLVLFVDGVLLAWFFHILNGLYGPVPYLVVLDVAAMTLLTSFRSGLKVAIWLCLLTLMVLNLEAVGALVTSATPTPLISWPVLLYVLAIWGTAMMFAALAAANERELRRRRFDAEVLRDFAVGVETAPDLDNILLRLSALVVEQLNAVRAAVVVVQPDDSLRYVRVDGQSPDGLTGDVEAGPRKLLQRVQGRPTTRALEQVDARLDPWVEQVLPHPQHVVVVPIASGGDVLGLLMFCLAPRRGRPGRVERRLAGTTEQAVAHAALAVAQARLVGQLRSMADTDGLTGLSNRQYFDRRFAAMLAEAERTGGSVAVVLADLDHFKQLNDTKGHLVGDEALKAAARNLQSAIRDCDLVARYGGEEFVAVLPGLSPDAARVAADRMRAAVASGQGVATVTASLGVAIYPYDGTDSQELLSRADIALYRAKETGRNRVCRYDQLQEVSATSGCATDDVTPPAGSSVLGTVVR